MNKGYRNKIIGIAIFLFGMAIFIAGNIFIKDFTGLWESLSDDTNVQIILMYGCFFLPIITCLSLATYFMGKEESKEVE